MFYTNLAYEQQRAYNELFDNYKEDRQRHINISEQNRKLLIEIMQLKSEKNIPVARNDFSCQTETKSFEKSSEHFLESAGAAKCFFQGFPSNCNETLQIDLLV